MKILKLVSDTNNERLDAWLATKLKEYSRSYLQKLISEGFIFIGNNNVKPNYKLKIGEEILIKIPEAEKLAVEPENIALDIIYEDDCILVINKPKGMVVHPAAGNYSGTLVNAVLNYCGDKLSDINGIIRPGIVHRLDKDTSGILVIAKNNEAHKLLSQKLKARDVKRVYAALVKGIIKENSGRIQLPIGRHPVDRKKMAVNPKNGREAITNFKVLERFGDSTYVEISLETGRTHQIRVHMAYIGHPVIGDEVYGGKQKEYGQNNMKGQVLHAKLIGFNHPATGEYVEYEASLPEYFKSLLAEKSSNNVKI
ncbi:MAG TPA: RluA family pseudouridine synthase [Clostridiales bacterium]|nr:RluA family pseudouridine synthase [Clostridiales bacterium]